MDDNGSGSAGGNGSVYWKVTHGNQQKNNPQCITALDDAGTVIRKSDMKAGVRASRVSVATPVPPPGHVAIGEDTVQGHTDCDFKRIGRCAQERDDDQHPGMFLVRLRFRKADLPKLSGKEAAWVMANRDPKLSDDEDHYVVIRVPAIDRKGPRPDGTWDDEKWEIHWEW
jgi:hypothetical protein